MKSYFALLLLFLSFATNAKPLLPITESELQSRIQILTQAPYNHDAKLKYIGEEAGCAILEISFSMKDPFSEKIFSYNMKLSWPHLQSAVPVILTVPTIEGVSQMEKSILNQMCKMNVAAIVAHVNNEGIDTSKLGASLIDNQLMRGAVAIRSLIDVLENLPAVENSPSISRVLIDTKKIGLVGLSAGSVSSLLATAVDERIKGLFIMGAIGNTPNALAFSEQSKVRRLRNAQMKHHKFKTQEQYENYLRLEMKASPVQFSSLLAKRNIYQVIIMKDSISPTEGQFEIKNTTKNQKVFVDKGVNGHGIALATEIMVNQFHLPYFVRTEIQ